MAKAQSRWYKINKDKIRNTFLLRKFGISLDQYKEILARQNGVCAICEKKNPNGRELAVDHDHSTGEIRGLLCSNCNTGLGNFFDDPKLLSKAKKYLAMRRKK